MPKMIWGLVQNPTLILPLLLLSSLNPFLFQVCYPVQNLALCLELNRV